MGKMRVYKLAKELEITSKELLDILNELGVEVSSHMSTIDDETAELIRAMYSQEDGDTETAEMQDTTVTEPAGQNGDKASKQGEDKAVLQISIPISVKELAEKTDYPSNQLIKELINLGIMANLNQLLDQATVSQLTDQLGIEVEITDAEQEEKAKADEKRVGPIITDQPEDLELRPPIVTIMGHVDHGKTTLLDVIRKTRVAESEAGGITQHIGAYQVAVKNKKITFVDTPGHEAFTAMRARGAQITDITILVVAADDGVMPQTIEAINHCRAADIQIIVAINKIDKANAQPERVMQELTEYGLVAEDWGGDTICVPISALQEENIDELLEMVLLVAEMEEIKANPNRLAEGIVLESKLDKGRGPVATVLVKTGTLRVGAALLAGLTSGRVRAMIDEQGRRIKAAPPSTPVEVLGFSDVPAAGDFVQVLKDEKQARQIAAKRLQKEHQESIHSEKRVSLEDLYQQIKQGEVKELNVIIKADVNGSIEALRDSLLKLGNEEVSINIIHTGVGGISETDVNLASASNAIIIGFNVRPDRNASIVTDREKVDIRLYRVIYQALEDVKDALSGLLDPEIKEVVTGRAEIRNTFKVPNVGIVAGLYVTEGVIERNFMVRLLRDAVVIYEGQIGSLKRFENDVREVKAGYECGLGIEGYNDLKVGDELEIYTHQEIKRTL